MRYPIHEILFTYFISRTLKFTGQHSLFFWLARLWCNLLQHGLFKKWGTDETINVETLKSKTWTIWFILAHKYTHILKNNLFSCNKFMTFWNNLIWSWLAADYVHAWMTFEVKFVTRLPKLSYLIDDRSLMNKEIIYKWP